MAINISIDATETKNIPNIFIFKEILHRTMKPLQADTVESLSQEKQSGNMKMNRSPCETVFFCNYL